MDTESRYVNKGSFAFRYSGRCLHRPDNSPSSEDSSILLHRGIKQDRLCSIKQDCTCVLERYSAPFARQTLTAKHVSVAAEIYISFNCDINCVFGDAGIIYSAVHQAKDAGKI
jgi:hypothetical protein